MAVINYTLYENNQDNTLINKNSIEIGAKHNYYNFYINYNKIKDVISNPKVQYSCFKNSFLTFALSNNLIGKKYIYVKKVKKQSHIDLINIEVSNNLLDFKVNHNLSYFTIFCQYPDRTEVLVYNHCRVNPVLLFKETYQDTFFRSKPSIFLETENVAFDSFEKDLFLHIIFIDRKNALNKITYDFTNKTTNVTKNPTKLIAQNEEIRTASQVKNLEFENNVNLYLSVANNRLTIYQILQNEIIINPVPCGVESHVLSENINLNNLIFKEKTNQYLLFLPSEKNIKVIRIFKEDQEFKVLLLLDIVPSFAYQNLSIVQQKDGNKNYYSFCYLTNSSDNSVINSIYSFDEGLIGKLEREIKMIFKDCKFNTILSMDKKIFLLKNNLIISFSPFENSSIKAEESSIRTESFNYSIMDDLLILQNKYQLKIYNLKKN